MKEHLAHLKHILLYYFRKVKIASQAYKKLRTVYGNEASKKKRRQNLFAKSLSRVFSLENIQRFGCLVEVSETRMLTFTMISSI